MKHILVIYCSLLFCLSAFAQAEPKEPVIYIDESGVMRWSDSDREASFYGVNYTLPFAHAYRAINYVGKNHKEAIDKDVYHFARLGFNAYRIHIWDVEISDSEGNVINNDHLDLLDYLIAKLKERDIRVLITAMTTFGNGYPEKNQKTGGFSYLYDKCDVHSNGQAIAAQEKYIGQLIGHVNPYTGLAYKDDPYIVGFEVNNEPCHNKSPQQTKEYIDSMLAAIGKTGNTKPVFYNVSHNMPHVESYYDTAVQGTTYQWYPIGLVSGHTRKGNFLPYVDNYHIPFSNVKGFDKKAKAIYEYDPADIMYSYMYPAMARTFRSRGFQWITQFAYDPIDIAWANTEYQTHYLNLAYTPNKAISMKIAAEAAYTVPRNKEYGKYPADTVFDNFHVSYALDLSELNTAEKFYYSNNTSTQPVNPAGLLSIAGCGSSPLIFYEGTGAYFLDKLDDGLWRLEVMPDAIQVQDPFEKPSLKKEVVTIVWNEWDMDIKIPDLGDVYTVQAINKGNDYKATSTGSVIKIRPGVYLLKNKNKPQDISGKWGSATKWNNITLGEYVAPASRVKSFSVTHQPAKTIDSGKSLTVEAQIVGTAFPDSVIIYTDRVSFWSDKNPYIKMKRLHGYTYQAEIPSGMINEGTLRYNIVVCSRDKTVTFPADVEGKPLDWDYYQYKYYETKVVAPQLPVELLRIAENNREIETYGIPETSYVLWSNVTNDFTESSRLGFRFKINDSVARFFWRKYIKNDIDNRRPRLTTANYLCLNIRNAKDITRLNVGFVTSDGFTYATTLPINGTEPVKKVRLSDLVQGKTAMLPSPYPTFLERYFTPDIQIPFDIQKIEMLELSTDEDMKEDSSFEIGSIWLE